MRRPFVAGNWKMYGTAASSAALAEGLKRELAGVSGVDVAVFPPFVYVPAVAAILAGSGIAVGAQDVCTEEGEAAFTGEVSGAMLKDVGCALALVGHSERRHKLGEDNARVHEKLIATLKPGLGVILCVGELLDERQAGKTEDVVTAQIREGLAGLDAAQMASVTIAYEPVWAIGTGRTATPDQAQEVHRMIRGLLGEMFDEATAAACRIQYGGSVKPENAATLMAQPDVDGGLVGGASLKADSFAAIVRAARTP